MRNPATPSTHRIAGKSGSRPMWLIAGAALAALTVQHEARAAAWTQVASMAEARQSHTTLRLLDGRMISIADTRKGKDDEGHFTDEICHIPESAGDPALSIEDFCAQRGLAVGDTVTARIDWARRHRLMRFHTTTHLLCHLVPRLVNGCSITPDYARLDFAMTEPPDKDALMQEIVAEGAETQAELDSLVSLGCDQVQGYSIAFPMPDQQAREWLAMRGQRRPKLTVVAGNRA